MRWPLLLVLVSIGVAVAALSAIRRSQYGWQGELPLLARSFRITQLPEYRRALRLHERLSAAALVASIIATAALIGAVVRPTWTYEPADVDNTPHVDIMLCFAPKIDVRTSGGTGLVPLMAALRDDVNEFGNQRIGMTKSLYRSFPVTADNQWVSERFDAIIGLVDEVLSAKDYGYLDRIGLFEPSPINRSQPTVQPTVLDTLAMCAMGLPAVGSDNGRGRMIVYIGNAEVPDDPGSYVSAPTGSIFSKTALAETIKSAKIQVNAIVPDMVNQPTGFVEELVKDSGGQHIQYTELYYDEKASQAKLDNQRDELATAVDKILAKPPASVLDNAQAETLRPFQWDVPDLLLQIALVAAIALAAFRLGMRL